MLVTTEKAVAIVHRAAKIKQGPVVHPAGYRRDFRVDTIAIRYTWEDGRFDVKDSFDIKMSGHWVKMNGDDAKDRASDMRPEYESYQSLEFTPMYRFLDPIIELLRPGADLSMMVLTEAEVGA